ncbi:hypothetical protein [Rappaport israeli]|nr:hypothetical protein [Rappaport israeli]
MGCGWWARVWGVWLGWAVVVPAVVNGEVGGVLPAKKALNKGGHEALE